MMKKNPDSGCLMFILAPQRYFDENLRVRTAQTREVVNEAYGDNPWRMALFFTLAEPLLIPSHPTVLGAD